MRSSENDGSNKQTVGNDVHQEARIYEDEINLIDYFLVLWKRKWFIFLASVLPALVVGLAIFLWPRDYKITYTYANMGLDEKGFKILEDVFYSTENLEKLVEEWQANNFNDYSKKIADSGTAEDLRGFISFEVLPLYFEAIKPSKAKDLDELEKFQQGREALLIMHLTAQPKEHIREIALVCRKNFEQIIPLYSEREQLSSKIINFKEKMAAIEEARYTLGLQLERKKSTLEKLKNSGSEGLDKLPSGIILQFDIEPSKAKDQDELQEFQNVNIGGNGVYLPLPYQIQAAETQIINLEEQIRANKEMYTYYAGLLNLNEKLFGYVKKVMPSYSTLEQFHSFLNNTLEEYKDQELLDYLKAYIKRIENKIANVIPLVERPKVYPVAKGTAKKSAIVFVVALMLSVFAAFLLEGLKKSQAQAS